MKKLFNHKKKPYDEFEDINEIEYEDEFYEDEDIYYSDEAEEEEDVFYSDEIEEEDEDIYYSDEVDEEEDVYYSDEAEEEDVYYSEEEYDEDIYYSDEEDEEDEAYYSDEVDEEEEVYYSDEIEEEDDIYYAEDLEERFSKSKEKTISAYSRKTPKKQQTNFFVKLWLSFLDMGTGDRVVLATGLGVLVLAIITGGVFLSTKLIDNQSGTYVSVGKELDGINLIGEAGLLAVADAELAKIAAANAIAGEEPISEEIPIYQEEELSKDVTIILNLSSIEKDLKIKFVNKKSGKLISNLPFSVTLTDPKGKTLNWSDDDMDGIIYKKDITPGKYKVLVNALSGEKYKEYTVPTSQESVTVKKEIDYKKVDVSNEAKTEAEINVAKEDTQINENIVESNLRDTVSWVESTSTLNTYIEVNKNTIPDPITFAYSGSFNRLAFTSTIDPGSKTLNIGESFVVTAKSSDVSITTVAWSSSNSSVATVDTSGRVTALGAGTAIISYVAYGNAVSGGDAISDPLTGSCSVIVNAGLNSGVVTIDNAAPTIAIGGKVDLKTTVSNFTANKELLYSISSDKTDIATATIDGNGNISINGIKEGDATLTVVANYKENGTDATAARTTIKVKVTGNIAITLDKTAATVYIGTPIVVHATLSNASGKSAISVETSDATIATATVNDKAITITGIKSGSVILMVKYKENNIEVQANCAITVKADPKIDKTTPLKDVSGNIIYVQENDNYREAVYADYYTASKFFLKGGTKYTGWQTLNGQVYYFDAAGNKITGEQVIQGAKYNFSSDGSLVTGNGTLGIDVSKWNGSINWNAVKNSGVSYVIIRCAYRGSLTGKLVIDPKFEANIKGANAAGLKVGVYFFTQAVSNQEALEEASYVLDLVKNYKISYPIFLDVESSGGRADNIDKATRTAVCKTFCQTIQNYGYTAGVYANKSWFTNKIDASQLSAYKIWLAQYATQPSYSGRYDMWQYQSTGRVSGISGNVDMNWSYLGY